MNHLGKRHLKAIGDCTNFIIKGSNEQELLKFVKDYQENMWMKKNVYKFFN